MVAIYDLAVEVAGYGSRDPDYQQRMVHKIPDAPVVDRAHYLLRRVKDRAVLDVGCTGKLSEALSRAARHYHGIDVVENPGFEHYYQVDLDRASSLPSIPSLELVVASEIIEHLSNAGHFLDLLRAVKLPVVLTTPNAFCESGYRHARKGVENVNLEHVAYYSYWTLKGLVERHGFRVSWWGWYNGRPGIAEGLIFELEAGNA